MSVELGTYTPVTEISGEHETEVQWNSLAEVPPDVPEPIKGEYFIVDLMKEDYLPVKHSSVRQDKDGGFSATKGYDVELGAFKIDLTTSARELKEKMEEINQAKLRGEQAPVVAVLVDPVKVAETSTDPEKRAAYKSRVMPKIRAAINQQLPKDIVLPEWRRIASVVMQNMQMQQAS